MLKQDSTAERLSEVAKVVNEVRLQSDTETLKRLKFELEALAVRATNWSMKMIPGKEKVVGLRSLENKSHA